MEERLRRSASGRSFELAGRELLGRIANGVATVTLNRPAALNALTAGMIRGLAEWLEAFAADDGVRVVLLRGADDKAFCAGGDVRAVYHGLDDREAFGRFFRDEYALDHRIHTYPKPIVALLDGIVMGGGMGISQGAALRVVGGRTRMAMPETAIGLFPDVGGSYFLSRTPGRLGLYLGLAGPTLGAADALYCGLADVYVAADALDRLDVALEKAAATADPYAAIRALVARVSGSPPPASLALLRPALDEHFGHDSVKGIVDSLGTEKRPAFRDWAEGTREALLRHSPTALAVTFEQLRRGAGLSLADCFRMELGLVHASRDHGDFREGVRARFIDKDQRPQWRPARLEDVSRDSIDAFFAPRWKAHEHPLAHLKP